MFAWIPHHPLRVGREPAVAAPVLLVEATEDLRHLQGSGGHRRLPDQMGVLLQQLVERVGQPTGPVAGDLQVHQGGRECALGALGLQWPEELNFCLKKMSLTLDEVRKIAALARLRLTPQEEERLTRELGEIVGYIDHLAEFETVEEGVAGFGLDLPSVEAADTAHACLPRETFLDNAPERLDGFLLVPEVKGDD
jgi:aspartyl-tRNA(Asn)/glutamyl-tRNA(Gln) amidotransferase subunit C